MTPRLLLIACLTAASCASQAWAQGDELVRSVVQRLDPGVFSEVVDDAQPYSELFVPDNGGTRTVRVSRGLLESLQAQAGDDAGLRQALARRLARDVARARGTDFAVDKRDAFEREVARLLVQAGFSPAPAGGGGIVGALGGQAVDPHLLQLLVCYGFGLKYQREVQLEPGQWAQVRALFQPAPATPRDERHAIARAVALIERLVGPLVGTSQDVGGWKGNMLGGSGHQMDCVDESANTMQYLALLRADGLVKFHAADKIRFRFAHRSAAMRDTTTDQVWIVDAWQDDNGELPWIQRRRPWTWSRPYHPEP